LKTIIIIIIIIILFLSDTMVHSYIQKHIDTQKQQNNW